MEQTSIFDFIYETYQIKKPIRLIELFAGYGSQLLSLKYLGTNVEHYKICEWATKSIQAYNDIHCRDYNDYSKKISKEQIYEFLYDKGISLDYNHPMTLNQIKRKGKNWCRITYNNIIATKNLVNIQQVQGKDLEIVDADKFEYIMTYSFPCQDLSLAGKQQGMSKDSGTRSGMLWEVERILDQLNNDRGGNLPQILLMENVPQVIGQKFIKDFQKWELKLRQLGYSNFVEILNAKNYGIPQNRERCFMVSILGQYNYKFPHILPLKYRLNDILELKVDEKYYLSDNMIKCFQNNLAFNGARKKQFERNFSKKEDIAFTITCNAGNRATDNFILVPEATKKGYDKAYEYDGVYINRPHQKRGVVQHGMIQTLKTSCNDVGVVVKIGNYSPSGHNAATIVDKNGIAPTFMNNHGTITAIIDDKPKLIGGIGEKKSNGGSQYYQQDRIYDSQSIAMCHPANLQTGSYLYQINNLCIRKLTPKECWRLMGVIDEDFYKASKNQSQSSLYHLAGDSIVTTCLMGIFGELLGIDYGTKINELVEELKEKG